MCWSNLQFPHKNVTHVHIYKYIRVCIHMWWKWKGYFYCMNDCEFGWCLLHIKLPLKWVEHAASYFCKMELQVCLLHNYWNNEALRVHLDVGHATGRLFLCDTRIHNQFVAASACDSYLKWDPKYWKWYLQPSRRWFVPSVLWHGIICAYRATVCLVEQF